MYEGILRPEHTTGERCPYRTAYADWKKDSGFGGGFSSLRTLVKDRKALKGGFLQYAETTLPTLPAFYMYESGMQNIIPGYFHENSGPVSFAAHFLPFDAAFQGATSLARFALPGIKSAVARRATARFTRTAARKSFFRAERKVHGTFKGALDVLRVTPRAVQSAKKRWQPLFIKPRGTVTQRAVTDIGSAAYLRRIKQDAQIVGETIRAARDTLRSHRKETIPRDTPLDQFIQAAIRQTESHTKVAELGQQQYRKFLEEYSQPQKPSFLARILGLKHAKYSDLPLQRRLAYQRDMPLLLEHHDAYLGKHIYKGIGDAPVDLGWLTPKGMLQNVTGAIFPVGMVKPLRFNLFGVVSLSTWTAPAPSAFSFRKNPLVPYQQRAAYENAKGNYFAFQHPSSGKYSLYHFDTTADPASTNAVTKVITHKVLKDGSAIPVENFHLRPATEHQKIRDAQRQSEYRRHVEQEQVLSGTTGGVDHILTPSVIYEENAPWYVQAQRLLQLDIGPKPAFWNYLQNLIPGNQASTRRFLHQDKGLYGKIASLHRKVGDTQAADQLSYTLHKLRNVLTDDEQLAVQTILDSPDLFNLLLPAKIGRTASYKREASPLLFNRLLIDDNELVVAARMKLKGDSPSTVRQNAHLNNIENILSLVRSSKDFGFLQEGVAGGLNRRQQLQKFLIESSLKSTQAYRQNAQQLNQLTRALYHEGRISEKQYHAISHLDTAIGYREVIRRDVEGDLVHTSLDDTIHAGMAAGVTKDDAARRQLTNIVSFLQKEKSVTVLEEIRQHTGLLKGRPYRPHEFAPPTPLRENLSTDPFMLFPSGETAFSYGIDIAKKYLGSSLSETMGYIGLGWDPATATITQRGWHTLGLKGDHGVVGNKGNCGRIRRLNLQYPGYLF